MTTIKSSLQTPSHPTTQANDFTPPSKETTPSFLSSIKRGLLNTTTTQRVAAVSILALGYVYCQSLSMNEVVDQLALPLIEHSSLQAPPPPEPSRDWSQTFLPIFSGLMVIQNLLPLIKGDPLLPRITQLEYRIKKLSTDLKSTSTVLTLFTQKVIGNTKGLKTITSSTTQYQLELNTYLSNLIKSLNTVEAKHQELIAEQVSIVEATKVLDKIKNLFAQIHQDNLNVLRVANAAHAACTILINTYE